MMHSGTSDESPSAELPPSALPPYRKAPETLEELFALYHDRYKPLYSYVQVLANQIPAELAFEMQAALDHISRHYQFQEPLERCLDLASRHIKRAILDCYKLMVRYILDEYEELRKIDLSIIDNGEFKRELRKLIAAIRVDATKARRYEGDTTAHGDWHTAFESWDVAFSNCVRFHEEFYLNENVDWARGKQWWKTWRQRVEGFVVGVISSFAAACLWWYFFGSGTGRAP